MMLNHTTTRTIALDATHTRLAPAGAVQAAVRQAVDALAAGEEIRLTFGSVAAVIGLNGGIGSRDSLPAWIDPQMDELSQHLTGAVYKARNYFDSGFDYREIAACRTPDTLTIRVIDWDTDRPSRESFGAPLYAMNLVPVQFEGRWGAIDHSRPSSVAPTFELLAMAAQQTITLGGQTVDLDEIDLAENAAYELAKASSLAEILGARSATTSTDFQSDALLGRYVRLANCYQAAPRDFFRKMREGRVLIGIALGVTALAAGIDLAIGNYSSGVVDRLLAEAIGQGANESPIQNLQHHGYHLASPYYTESAPYFDSHPVIPFALDMRPFARQAIAHNSQQIVERLTARTALSAAPVTALAA